MTELAVAQLNIGRVVAPLDDPIMAGFVGRLAEINALAEASSGFVWRLTDESGGDATGIRAYDDPRVIVNLTMWTGIEELAEFAYRSRHVEVLRRRRNWFEPHDGPHLVLWWLPIHERPRVDEAKRRLALLARDGPTVEAFTLKDRFGPPEVVAPR